jgi:hypothetical protein
VTSFPKARQGETACAAIASGDYQAVTLGGRSACGSRWLALEQGAQRSEANNPARTRPLSALLVSSHVMTGVRYFAGTNAPIEPRYAPRR